MISAGHVPSLSYSHATGRISLTAKSCAISRKLFCSSVSVKSTILESPIGRARGHRLTGQSIYDRQGSEQPADRQESVFVHDAPSIMMLAVAAVTLSFLLFSAVVLCLIMSLAFMGRSRSGNVYDQIGAGGIFREGDYEGGAPGRRPTSPRREPSASGRSARC